MSRTPAVLLISPGILRWTDMDFGLPHLVSLGGYLRHHLGVRVEILDLNYEGGDHRTLEKRLDELGPFLLVGLSTYSSFDYLRVMALARFLKAKLPGVPLITGGYHASALPDDVVYDGSPFDAVVVGEGERPIAEIVTRLLGGGDVGPRIWNKDQVEALDELPPYAWDLLDRYWPRATQLGRKLQVYLSRGCTYHCTFCMERSKSGYTWRAFSPERAVEELRRLGRFTDLSQWVVNLADPLFGFQRRWRREVLNGILEAGIVPRQFWTLTRSDDLDEEDVSLLARARFSIGIGLESGSPRMLRLMQKGNAPERYLDAIRRLARLSRVHGLSWATNVIVGHPGEDVASMEETLAFLTELFTSAPETCGWLSVDPFRLYPGAQVQQEMATWSAEHGTVFHHPRWWTSWYDGPFQAQHIDPSATLDYATRVRFLHDRYAPLLGEVQRRFRGQGRSVDRVFERSLADQRAQLAPTRRDQLLALGRAAHAAPTTAPAPALAFPIGMRQKDPWVRRREAAVRRLLDHGALRSEAVITALLSVAPEHFLSEADAQAVLDDRAVEATREGLPAPWPLRTLALGLEALGVAPGDRVIDTTALTGFEAALLAELVGPEGTVLARVPAELADAVRARLAAWPQVQVQAVRLADLLDVEGEGWDAVWIGAALPRLPKALRDHVAPDARVVTALGPRFRDQDLVVAVPGAAGWDERVLTRVRVPVLGGRHGWVPAPHGLDAPGVRLLRMPGPAHAFRVLAHLDLGADAASLHDPRLPPQPWGPALRAAYDAAPGRLALHGLALTADEVVGLVHRLREGTVPALDDAPGKALRTAFADALEALPPEPVPALAPRDLEALLIGPIARIRAHVWGAQGRAAPPLDLLHVPALGRYARATTWKGRRRVATALDGPPELVALQVLHEELHPITDPVVLARHASDAERDTRVGAAGWALHAELEATVIAATEALVSALAPELTDAFVRWLGGVRLRTHGWEEATRPASAADAPGPPSSPQGPPPAPTSP